MANSTTGDGSYSPNIVAGDGYDSVGGNTGTVFLDTGTFSVDFIASGRYGSGQIGDVDGTITVTGDGTDVTVADAGLYAYSRITVGAGFDSYIADGSLYIYNGATITSTNNAALDSGGIPIGGYSNLTIGTGGDFSTGLVVVDGTGGLGSSILSLEGGSAGFVMGADGGTGTLTVSNGGQFFTLTGVVGAGATTVGATGGMGTVNVDGVGSEFFATTNNGNFLVNTDQAPVIFVGQNDGSGYLNVDNGGLVAIENVMGDGKSSPTLVFGDTFGSYGRANVRDGSDIQITQYGPAATGNRLNGNSGLIVGNGGTAYVGVTGNTGMDYSAITVLGDRANVVVSRGSYDGQGAPIAPGGQSRLSAYFGGTVTVDSQTYGGAGGATATVGAGRLSDGYLQVGSYGVFTVRSDTDFVGDYTTGRLTIGDLGAGYLRVGSFGSVYSNELIIGARGYTANPLNNSTNQIYDGESLAVGGGVGIVTVNSGDSKIVVTGTDNSPNRGITIGQASATSGMLNISYANSYVKSTGGAGLITVGKYGGGGVAISNQGNLYGGTIIVSAAASNSTDIINVSGIGSRVVASGAYSTILSGGLDTSASALIQVGLADGSDGRISVNDGAELRLENDSGVDQNPRLVLGVEVGSEGEVSVSGSGSPTPATSTLNIIQQGARFMAPSGDVLGGAELIVGLGGVGTFTAGYYSAVNVQGDGAGLLIGVGGYDGSGDPVISAVASTVTINNGGDVLIDSETYGSDPSASDYSDGSFVEIGGGVGGYGRITVEDSGSTLTVTSNSDFAGDYETGRLVVGGLGRGELTVNTGAAVDARSLQVGANSFYDDGMGGGRQYGGYLANVTAAGDGDVSIVGGADVTITAAANTPVNGVRVAEASGATGSITVVGSGSTLTSRGGQGHFLVGGYGTGDIYATNSGAVYGLSFEVGRSQGSDGDLRVSGYGSRILASNAYGDFSADPQYAGRAGAMLLGAEAGSDGTLFIQGGGRVDVINDAGTDYDNPSVVIARDYGATGRLVVSGYYMGSGTYASTLRIEQTGPVGDFVATDGIGPYGPSLVIGVAGAGSALISNYGEVIVTGAAANLTVAEGKRDGAGNPYMGSLLSTLTITSNASVLVDSQNYGGSQTFMDSAGNPVEANLGSSVIVGDDVGANGQITLGTGGSLTVQSSDVTAGDYQNANIIIGNQGGSGGLTVTDMGVVNARGLQVGNGAGSFGQVFAFNNGYIVITSTDATPYQGIRIGEDGGTGSINVNNGSVLTSTGGAGLLRVGDEATGALNISVNNASYGGQVNAFYAEIGRGAGSDGNVLISGAGSALTLSDAYGAFDPSTFGPLGGTLFVGRGNGGDGYVNVVDGASLNVINDSMAAPAAQGDGASLTIGDGDGAVGLIQVSGDDGMGNASYVRVQNYGRSNDGFMPGEYYGPELRLGRNGGDGSLLAEQGAEVNVVGERAQVIIGQGIVDGDYNAETTSLLSVTSGASLVADSRPNPDTSLPYNAAADIVLGLETGGNGRLLVTGAGSTVNVFSDNATDYYVSNGNLAIGAGVEVGRYGSGILDVEDGGQIIIDGADDAFPHFTLGLGDVYNGTSISTSGIATVTGSGSLVQIIGTSTGAGANFAVGTGGTIDVGNRAGAYGYLTISNGGVVFNSTVNSKTQIAPNTGATGKILVTGASSTLNAGTYLTVGADIDLATGEFYDFSSGDAILTIYDQGQVDAGSTYVGSTGLLNIDNAALGGEVEVRGEFQIAIDNIGSATIQGALTQRTGLLEFDLFHNGSGIVSDSLTADSAIFLGDAITIDVQSAALMNVGDSAIFFQTQGTLSIDDLDSINIVGANANAGQQFAIQQSTIPIGQGAITSLAFVVQQASLATISGDLKIVSEADGLVALTSQDVSIVEAGVDPTLQTLTVTNPFGGQLESALDPGVAITSFSQQDVDDRLIRFVSDGNSVGFFDLSFTDSSGFTETVTIEAVTPGVPDTRVDEITPGEAFNIDGVTIGGYFGYSVSSAGDVNGDGIDDLIVGAPVEEGDNPGSGAAFVIFGSLDPIPTEFDLTLLNGTNGFEIRGDAAEDMTGISVAAVGDVNGDGFDDIAIGATGATSQIGDNGAGKVYILFGDSAPIDAVVSLAGLATTEGIAIDGGATSAGLGATVVGGADFNGDGVSDIVVGSYGASLAGEVFVVFGNDAGLTGPADTNALDGTNGFRISGLAASEFLGSSVSQADLNDDGLSDLIIGASGALSGDGSVFVVKGVASPTADIDVTTLSGADGFRIDGIGSGAGLGASVSTTGDFNGDGIDDIVLGAPGAGSVFVIFGVVGGFNDATFDLTTLDGTNGFQIDGRDFGDSFGQSVSSVGDMNGDGFGDFLIGAPTADPFGMITGEAYLIFGYDEGFAAQQNVTALNDDQLSLIRNFDILDSGGYATGGGFDINGDGLDDAIVGAINAGAMDEGRAVIVFGAVRPSDPIIEGDLLVNADQGQSGQITNVDVIASEVDAIPIDLLFHATNIIGGFIENADAPGTPIQTFTQQEIDAGVILFAKDATTETGSFDLTVTDKDGDVSAPVTVNVQTTVLANSFKLADLDGVNGFRLNGTDLTDLSGLAVSDAGDINGDGFDDVLIGAPYADTPNNEAGETYVIFGATGGFAADIELSDIVGPDGFRVDGVVTTDLSGRTLATAGDLNDDGIDDFMIGVSGADNGQFNIGDVFVVYGTTSGFPDSFSLTGFNGTNGTRISGVDFNSLTSAGLSEVGDFNGDGIDDIFIGAPFADSNNGADAGEGYLVFGATGGLGAQLNLSTLNGTNGFRVDGPVGGGLTGITTGIGDINNDGFADIALSGGDADPLGRANAGATLVLFGSDVPFSPIVQVNALDGTNGFRVDGAVAGDRSGDSVSTAGDFNDDGIDDFIIGALGAGGTGAAYVTFGTEAGFDATLDLGALDGVNGFVIQGADAGDRFGVSVADAGDFDGDGIADLLISADQADPGGVTTGGAAYVLFGRSGTFAPTLNVGQLDPTDGFRIDSILDGDQLGRSVSGAGDVNNDGRDDIVLGAFAADPGGTTTAGQSYVVFGFGPNQPPIARDDVFLTDEDLPISGDLFADNGDDIDEDVDGDAFTLIALNGNQTQVGIPVILAGSGAIVTVQSDGQFDYDPTGVFDDLAEGELGSDQFTYTIGNAIGETSTATVDLVISGVNDDPVAIDDAVSVSEDDNLAGDLFADNGFGIDFDIDSPSFTVVEVNGSPTNVGAPFQTSGGGQVTFNTDGTFGFQTSNAYETLGATDSFDEVFTYTIEDDFGARSTANLTITVNGANDAPTALDDDFITDEDTSISGDFFADNGNGADFDIDAGDTFTLTAINGITPVFDTPFELPNGRGTLTVRNDGTFDFTPSAGADVLAEGAQDQFSFNYTITDDQGDTGTANVFITLNGLNDAPVALPDDFTISQDDDLSGDLFLDNGIGPDLDIDLGDTFTITAINGDAGLVGQSVGLTGGGAVVVNDDGTFDFTNNGGYVGLAVGQTADLSFTYTITDNNGATSTTTADLTVVGLNDPPIALDDDFITDEETGISGNFFADNGNGPDFDVDAGANFTLSAINGNTPVFDTPFELPNGRGTLTVRNDGTFDFTPSAGANVLAEGAQDQFSFNYTITDDQGATGTANVFITLNGLNDAPVALPDDFTVSQDDDFSGDLFSDNGGGPDQDFDLGDTFTITAINGDAGLVGQSVGLTGGGAVVVNDDGTFDFTNNGGYGDLASRQTADLSFTYTITDNNGATSTTTADLTVVGLNDPPIALDDDFITDEETGITGNFFADNGNGVDFDVDAGASFTLSAINGNTPVFDTPFELPNGRGTLTVRNDGTFDFTPSEAANVLGEGQQDQFGFTYSITDDQGAISTANVSITLNGVNDAPVAINDNFAISQDDDLSGDLFAANSVAGADFDIDNGDVFTITAVNGDAGLVGQSVDLTGGGGVVVNHDGTFDFSNNGAYVDLAEGQTADLSFTYTISDNNGATSTASVNLRVNGANDAPVAIADAFSFSEQAIAGEFNVLTDNGAGPDADPDGDPVALSAVNGQPVLAGGLNFFTTQGLGVMITQGGDFRLSDPNNVFDFLDEGETATDGFTYTIRDPQGLTTSSEVTFNIDGVNDAPVAVNDQVRVIADQTAVFDPIAGGLGGGQDNDPEGEPLTLATINGEAFTVGDVIALPSGANVAVNLDGTLEYRPSGAFDDLGPDETAQDSFDYEIEDAGGLRAGAQVLVQIRATSFPPVANDDQIATTEDDVLIADLFAENGNGLDQNFSDGALLLTGINGVPIADGASVTLGSGAILSIDETGRVRYDPNGVFNGLNAGQTAADTFLYTVTDADGLQDQAEVSLTIAGANDAPQAFNDRFTTDERTALSANLFDDNGAGLDFDVDSTFTITAVNGDTSLVGQPINLASGAQLAIGPNGGLNFDPNGAFMALNDGEQAVEELTYTITDTEGASATATFIVRVTGITDTVFGTNGDDIIRGTENDDDINALAGNDLITGLAGNDSIKGSAGVDIIRGGADDDLLQGGADRDRLFGEGGNDRLEGGGGADRLLGLSGDDTVIGGAGDDVASGGGGDDLVIGADGDDRLRGGRDADTLLGGAGRDSLQGGSGRDNLMGQAGNDNLTGAGGADTLSGGDGIDRLFGRRGNDELTGGEGSDRFIFNLGDGFDTITDFDQGVDRIRIGTGAEAFGDLTITQQGDDALISFGNVRILALDEDANDFTNSDFIL